MVQIFSPTKGLPVYSAMRMQHYALFLQGFNYTIKYRKSKEHSNADCLSRLPIQENNTTYDVVDEFQICTIETLPVKLGDLAEATNKDTELSKIANKLRSGLELTEKQVFNINSYEFSLQRDVIMRGHRVVIPGKLGPKIVHQLHSGHFGVAKMKSLARGHCWWPGIDSDIEKLTKNCSSCNTFKNNPTKERQHVWEPETVPFHRVYADFVGPFMGKMFFVLIDAFSKWPIVQIVHDITATTIKKCEEIFATYGIPKVFVSDNGRTFTSQEFQKFLEQFGIIQKFTAPYHPATNGQAERFVQTFKNALKKMTIEKMNIDAALQKLLLKYRTMTQYII